MEILRAGKAIPRVDGRGDAAALALAMRDRVGVLIGSARDYYGTTALKLGDRLSRRWLEKTRNPYLAEILAIARVIDAPGAVLLNLSYEWACSAAVAADPDGGGMRLLRTLDWPLPGLGRTVVAADRSGRQGEYLDFTWPGMVGVLTAVARGRFAAAINQPPMARRTSSFAVDWLIGRGEVWMRNALPPSHLLRHVFDTCATYAEARRMLVETPIALPVFFTLAGAGDGEGCVIERGEREATVHEAPACITNHWLSGSRSCRPRAADSLCRLEHMGRVAPGQEADLAWVVPPVRVPETRLAVDLAPRSGRAAARGYERDGPATAVSVF